MIPALVVLLPLLWPQVAAIPLPELPKQLRGNWCRGEGSYIRDVSRPRCQPTDRIIITARRITFHEHYCDVRSAVKRPDTRKTHWGYHATFWCHHQSTMDPTNLVPTSSYWLGIHRGSLGNNLFLHETDETFVPKDPKRFLREHPE